MDIFEELSMGLDHTQLIIQNKHFLPVLFKAGVLGKTLHSAIIHTHIQGYARCTAPSQDLDGERHLRRSRAHTDELGEAFELGVLWDEYGIVGDVIVNFLIIIY